MPRRPHAGYLGTRWHTANSAPYPCCNRGLRRPTKLCPLTECTLDFIDPLVCFTEQMGIALAASHGSPCGSQLPDKFCTVWLRQCGVAHPPKPTPYYKVPAIRRYGMSASKSASFHDGSLNVNPNQGFLAEAHGQRGEDAHLQGAGREVRLPGPHVRADVFSKNRPGAPGVPAIAEEHQARGRECPRTDRPNRDMARDHRAGGQVEPYAARMGELLPSWHRQQPASGMLAV
jgi:hypothetical protein